MLRKLALNILNFVGKDEKRVRIIFLSVIIFLGVLLLKNFIVMLTFITLGAISMFHQRFTRSYFGFELCTLGTVFTGMYFGFTYGVLVGVLSITLGLIISGNFDHGIFLSVGGFALIGIASSFVALDSIVTMGIICTVIYDVAILTFYLFTGSNPASCISYFVTHLYTNYWVFKIIGVALIKAVN